MISTPPLATSGHYKEGDHLLIVPGFLTEQASPNLSSTSGQLEKIVHQVDQYASKRGRRAPFEILDVRGWQNIANQSTLSSVSTELFHWPSQNLIKIIQNQLFPFFKDTFTSIQTPHTLSQASYKRLIQFHATWSQALTDADQSIPRLYQHIQKHLSRLPPSYSIIILGHSLGGRIILKAFDLCRQKLDVKQFNRLQWVAWAPAIIQNELPASFFSSTSSLKLQKNQLELSYSDHDHILRYLFPLGRISLSGVMGLDLAQIALIMLKESKKPSQVIGAQGILNPPLNFQQINLSHQGIGHFDYLPYFQTIAQQSPILKPLLSPVP